MASSNGLNPQQNGDVINLEHHHNNVYPAGNVVQAKNHYGGSVHSEPNADTVTPQHQGHDVVPVIDFSPFILHESPQTAAAIVSAFKSSGFVYLINHGMSQDLVDEAFSWSKKFFDLPQEIKDSVPHPPEPWWHRGYSAPGREKVSMTTTMLNSPSSSPSEIATAKSLARTIPDYKESFELGREDNDRMKNIWLPESHLPGFRAFMNHFYEVMQTLEMAVFRAIAIGLEMEDEEFFVRFHQNADNQTRLLHYPPVPLWVLREGKMERCGGHADFGTITFLFQDGVGGLEVEDQDQEQPEGLEGPEGGKGVFRPVPSVRGAVLVNVGDCLQMWTNGILSSAVHRVAAPPAFEGVGLEEPGSPGGGGEDPEEMMIPSRYSIPYFCGPDTEKVLECAPGCWSAETPKRYGPMTVGEFIDAKMALLV